VAPNPLANGNQNGPLEIRSLYGDRRIGRIALGAALCRCDRRAVPERTGSSDSSRDGDHSRPLDCGRCCQDAFAGLGRHVSTVTNPAAYLQRSVVNLSIRVTRRRATVARQPRGFAPVTNLPDLNETWVAVTKLPARQRAVVALRFWSDMSEVEIANALGWPAGTVKSTLHRALKQLRKDLAP
jgi:hypothetical protein